MKKSNEYNKSPYITLIDLQKSSDLVHCAAVMETMKEQSVQKTYTNTLEGHRRRMYAYENRFKGKWKVIYEAGHQTKIPHLVEIIYGMSWELFQTLNVQSR